MCITHNNAIYIPNYSQFKIQKIWNQKKTNSRKSSSYAREWATMPIFLPMMNWASSLAVTNVEKVIANQNTGKETVQTIIAKRSSKNSLLQTRLIIDPVSLHSFAWQCHLNLDEVSSIFYDFCIVYQIMLIVKIITRIDLDTKHTSYTFAIEN